MPSQRDSNLESSALEVDALTIKATRRSLHVNLFKSLRGPAKEPPHPSPRKPSLKSKSSFSVTYACLLSLNSVQFARVSVMMGLLVWVCQSSYSRTGAAHTRSPPRWPCG